MQGNCALCRRYTQLEQHHVYSGPYRKKADKYGAVIYICHDCHTGRDGIQYNRQLADEVKGIFQERLMRQHNWTTQDFIREFGRNYIKEEIEC